MVWKNIQFNIIAINYTIRKLSAPHIGVKEIFRENILIIIIIIIIIIFILSLHKSHLITSSSCPCSPWAVFYKLVESFRFEYSSSALMMFHFILRQRGQQQHMRRMVLCLRHRVYNVVIEFAYSDLGPPFILWLSDRKETSSCLPGHILSQEDLLSDDEETVKDCLTDCVPSYLHNCALYGQYFEFTSGPLRRIVFLFTEEVFIPLPIPIRGHRHIFNVIQPLGRGRRGKWLVIQIRRNRNRETTDDAILLLFLHFHYTIDCSLPPGIHIQLFIYNLSCGAFNAEFNA